MTLVCGNKAYLQGFVWAGASNDSEVLDDGNFGDLLEGGELA